MDGKGEFKDRKKWPRRRRGNLVYRLIRIIKESRIRGAATVILVDENSGRLKRRGDYNVAMIYCMTMLTLEAESLYPERERVAFMLDERRKGESEIEDIRRRLKRRFPTALAERIGPATFDDSKIVVALQVADLLAYEVHRIFGEAVKPAHDVTAPPYDTFMLLSPHLIEWKVLTWSAKGGIKDLADEASA